MEKNIWDNDMTFSILLSPFVEKEEASSESTFRTARAAHVWVCLRNTEFLDLALVDLVVSMGLRFTIGNG